MAGGMDMGSTGRGGKKPVDVAINLVPFIDLMMVTIAFLIMTAVWTQVGRLEVAQAGGLSAPDTAQKEPEVPVSLHISERALTLTVGAQVHDPLPLVRNARRQLDLSELTAMLKEVKASLPGQSAITLQTEDSVRYEDLVNIIDACVGSELPAVAVSPAST